MISGVVETVEPVLCFARECVAQGACDDTGKALRACSAYLNLYRPPIYEVCNAAAFLRDRLHELQDDAHVFTIEPVHDGVGDTSQVADIVAMIVHGVALEEESVVVAEVFDLEQAPCVALSLEGAGRFPQEFAVDGLLRTSLDELQIRWTSATRGGRIERSTNGLLLRLTGQRMPPDVTGQYETLREAVDDALRVWETRQGGDVVRAVDKALGIIDGEGGRSPADLHALLSEALQTCEADLTKHSIVLDKLFAKALPPIVVHRKRLRDYVTGLAAYAQDFLIEGGAMTLLLDYDSERRVVELAANVSCKESGPGDRAHQDRCLRCTLASLRRAVVDVHGGEFEVEVSAREATITAILPDGVGRTLDEWIPHFEVFTERSKQVLRLLRSGGETPPEDLLLAGVLEEELERWLLPRLSETPAINVAHEIATTALLQDRSRGKKRACADRLDKVLDQIKRGKPRREIAKPPYAAAILHAFNIGERGRKAIGAEAITEAEVEKLCSDLQGAPPDYTECLRIIARARYGAQ